MSVPAVALPRQVPLDEYPRPPLRVLTEVDLLGRLEPVPCACGTHVLYAPDEPVQLVVERHNATVAHLAWRAQREA